MANSATTVFIQNGYRRTQIADVARSMGVAKGTIYLYVESKEALLDLALRASEPGWQAPSDLPIPTPADGATARYVAERLMRDGKLATLATAASADDCANPQAELERVVGELFDVLWRHHIALKLVDRCAHDRPDLAAVFYDVARNGVPALLRQYIDRRTAQGSFRPVADTRVAARTLVEIVAFWCVHHPHDPAPSAVDPHAVRQTVIELCSRALLA